MSELLDMTLTITRDFSWKPGFQYRIRNLGITTSPSQRSTNIWHALKSRTTFSRNFTRFSSTCARCAVIWITRTNIIFQLMKAWAPAETAWWNIKKIVNVKPLSHYVTLNFRVRMLLKGAVITYIAAIWCKITSLSSTRVSGWTLNGIWSFLRPWLQASRFPLKMVKDCPSLQAKCFKLNSDRSVSINVNKMWKHFSRNIHGAHIFPNVSQFPTRKILFPVSAFVFKMQIMLTLYDREF